MQKRKFSSVAATFILCYLFWLLLTMSLAPVELISGAVVCLITAWFSAGFFIQNNKHAFRLLNPVVLAKMVWFFCVVFLGEVLKSNWAMAKTVLTGAPLKQCIIKVPVHGITSMYGLAMLADCITLTPGTITTEVLKEGENYYMYVQWLIMETDDPEKAGEIIKGRMEKWIGGIWG